MKLAILLQKRAEAINCSKSNKEINPENFFVKAKRRDCRREDSRKEYCCWIFAEEHIQMGWSRCTIYQQLMWPQNYCMAPVLSSKKDHSEDFQKMHSCIQSGVHILRPWVTSWVAVLIYVVDSPSKTFLPSHKQKKLNLNRNFAQDQKLLQSKF